MIPAISSQSGSRSRRTPSQPRPPTYGGTKNRSGSWSTSSSWTPGRRRAPEREPAVAVMVVEDTSRTSSSRRTSASRDSAARSPRAARGTTSGPARGSRTSSSDQHGREPGDAVQRRRIDEDARRRPAGAARTPCAGCGVRAERRSRATTARRRAPVRRPSAGRGALQHEVGRDQPRARREQPAQQRRRDVRTAGSPRHETGAAAVAGRPRRRGPRARRRRSDDGAAGSARRATRPR